MVKHEKLINMLKTILILSVLFYATLVLIMYLIQRQLLYFPRAAPVNIEYQVVEIESERRTVMVVTDGRQRQNAVIYFGGNGEDVYAGVERMQAAFIDKAAYYVNYPGYGGSTGSPTETTITQTARDVFKYVSARHPSVAVMGRSLGTGVAIKLASEYEVSQLVLISPYLSIASLAAEYYPFFPRALIKDKFDSVSRVAIIQADTLVIMAGGDEIIPPAHSLKLIEAFKLTQPVSKIYTHADHNNVHLETGFMQLVREFIAQSSD